MIDHIDQLANLITSFATLIAAIGGILISWHNSNKIKEIRTATDGMTDALVAATDKASHAAGKEEGRIAGEVKAEELIERNRL